MCKPQRSYICGGKNSSLRTMELTTVQKKEFISEMASRQEGLNELARVLLDTFSLQERAQLFYELYTRGLSCEDIGVICERIYGHHYSKQQVSFLSSQSKAEVVAWLSRPLSARCLTLYIDATFTPHPVRGKRKPRGVLHHPLCTA